jgi:hypothetical protein
MNGIFGIDINRNFIDVNIDFIMSIHLILIFILTEG